MHRSVFNCTYFKGHLLCAAKKRLMCHERDSRDPFPSAAETAESYYPHKIILQLNCAKNAPGPITYLYILKVAIDRKIFFSSSQRNIRKSKENKHYKAFLLLPAIFCTYTVLKISHRVRSISVLKQSFLN